MIKRLMDAVVAGTLLALCLPVLVVLLIGSAVSLRAFPIFTQTRIGLDGKPFRFLKVRTLFPSTPAYTDKYALASVPIPRFCQIVRRLHLDELPQLLLVITGRMSLVGPRPEMPSFHDAMSTDFARTRTSIRPGCTGLWQISQAKERLIAEHPEFDEYYVTHRSLRLDLWIMYRTLRQMLPTPSSAIEFADLPTWLPSPAVERHNFVLIDA